MMDMDHEETFLVQIQSKLSQGSKISSDDWQRLQSLNPVHFPWLTRSYLEHHSHGLVRHLGMVQDMMDPDYFMGTGLEEEHLFERQPLLVVPIPFASDWYCMQQRAEEATHTHSVVIPPSPPDRSTRKRDRDRHRDQESGTPMVRHKTERNDGDEDEILISPSSPMVHGAESDWWPAGTFGSHPDESPVLAKLYYDQYPGNERLRLNDLVELVGVVSMDPAEGATWEEHEYPTPPPPSRLPRLHVLSFRRTDLDTLTPPHDIVKNPLQVWTTHYLCSSIDTTLSEALLLTLCSKAERRKGDIQRGPQHALGCASLQLISSNSQRLFEHLSTFLATICPVMAAVDCSESGPPSKETGHLLPTPWQLPRGATLLLHLPRTPSAEMRQLLDELCTQHRLTYTFEGGMQLGFEADYRIIVVTGERVTMPCTFQCQVEDIIDSGHSALRSALAYARSLPNIALPTSVMEQAQHDFLQRRKQARMENQRLPGETDFHRWLTLTRLYARARGLLHATMVDWEAALRLDDKIHDTEQNM